MANMKTLTVEGETYTVTDGSAVHFHETQSLTDDQKARARENIGAASASDISTKTLIWSNASPTSGFGAQTITFNTNISQYDEIEIVCRTQMSPARYSRVMIPCVSSAAATCIDASTEGATAISFYNRKFTISSTTQIVVAAGYRATAVFPTALAPFKIYGIKGVITE